MLKIRYNIETGQLSGWTDNETEDLIARDGEAIEVIDIPKPDVDDYEYCYYRDGALVVVEPQPARDPLAEIDDLRMRVKKLEKK